MAKIRKTINLPRIRKIQKLENIRKKILMFYWVLLQAKLNELYISSTKEN